MIRGIKKDKLIAGNQPIEITGAPAGLAKTRKLTRTSIDMERQFYQLCKMINLDNKKNERSERQREDRRAKRIK